MCEVVLCFNIVSFNTVPSVQSVTFASFPSVLDLEESFPELLEFLLALFLYHPGTNSFLFTTHTVLELA